MIRWFVQEEADAQRSAMIVDALKVAAIFGALYWWSQ